MYATALNVCSPNTSHTSHTESYKQVPSPNSPTYSRTIAQSQLAHPASLPAEKGKLDMHALQIMLASFNPGGRMNPRKLC